jgi:hypothetical protein
MNKLAVDDSNSSAETALRNALVAFLADLFREPAIKEALGALIAPSEPVSVGLVKAKVAAKAIGASITTFNRLAREPGAPCEMIGAQPRYDIEKFRAWLAARGKKPTTPSNQRSTDPIDVTSVLNRAGLRVVGGRE